MKVILDNIIFCLQKTGGISVVWYELIKHLLDDINIDTFFVDYESKNILGSHLPIPIQKKIKLNSLIDNRYWNVVINQKQKFIFHSSYYRICKNPHAINITTVHDFTYEKYVHGLKKWLHSWQKKRAIMNSDFIICISENTKKDVLGYFPNIDPKKIRVVYNGVSEDYYVLPKKEQDIFFEKKYILFVGGRAGYKNFELAALAVSQTQFDFVIVGAPLNKKEISFLKKIFGTLERIHVMGRISNAVLNRLYNNAFALLYPSLYEGFGIPILEAQKAGCPVIAYASSSIPEIMGDSPLLMHFANKETIYQCLNSLEDKNFRAMVIKQGLENVKRFSWHKMYQEVLSIYREAWKQ